MVKYVKLQDNTGLKLNMAKAIILQRNKNAKHISDNTVIYLALNSFIENE